jgi:G:T-mismatch repair DNA endonuclease (very short patch repair protein)
MHIANLIIAERVCIECLNNLNCNSGCRVFVFYTNKEFCDWLFDNQHKDYTAIAHNLQGYDGIFLMKYIKETTCNVTKNFEILMNGTKILTLKYRDVRLVDSFSFIPMSLEKFPKTFGLTELKKGYFPHDFNLPENQTYKGIIPDKEKYGYKFFSNAKLNDFEIWYAKKSKELFDFKDELESYCLSDVKLLKDGCLTFRKIILDISGGIDPFMECITLASLCHLIFRKSHMLPKSIGIIPILGFNAEQTSSNVCIQWLKYISWSQNIYIRHARNGGEVKLGKYRVDGYSETITDNKLYKIIYEFHGCYFHGCKICFTDSTWNQTKQCLNSSIYQKHLHRIESIKKDFPDYKLIEIWECEFREQIKNSKNLQYFLKTECNISDPIDPRNCLFGGRTNSLKLYHKAIDGEKIKYVDFRSLYPDRQKYGIYPIGQPEIITENFLELNNYFGLIKCKILPPKGLYLPVLPCRIDKKLFFTLCYKCATEKIDDCNHTDLERCLEGEWVSLEVMEALNQGYKILHVYEIWHYKETSQYNPITKQGGLFTTYVDTFMKYKEEASGWPDNVTTNEEKKRHVQNFYNLEGIHLNEENIKYNPGIRSVMKLILNSLWGKFGMQTNKTQVKFINKLSEWYQMIESSEYNIQDINLEIPGILTVYYNCNKKCFDGGSTNNNINVVIASFVTAHARLKLLSVMQKLGKRTLYHDTGKYNIFLITKLLC